MLLPPPVARDAHLWLTFEQMLCKALNSEQWEWPLVPAGPLLSRGQWPCGDEFNSLFQSYFYIFFPFPELDWEEGQLRSQPCDALLNSPDRRVYPLLLAPKFKSQIHLFFAGTE